MIRKSLFFTLIIWEAVLVSVVTADTGFIELWQPQSTNLINNPEEALSLLNETDKWQWTLVYQEWSSAKTTAGVSFHIPLKSKNNTNKTRGSTGSTGPLKSTNKRGSTGSTGPSLAVTNSSADHQLRVASDYYPCLLVALLIRAGQYDNIMFNSPKFRLEVPGRVNQLRAIKQKVLWVANAIMWKLYLIKAPNDSSMIRVRGVGAATNRRLNLIEMFLQDKNDKRLRSLQYYVEAYGLKPSTNTTSSTEIEGADYEYDDYEDGPVWPQPLSTSTAAKSSSVSQQSNPANQQSLPTMSTKATTEIASSTTLVDNNETNIGDKSLTTDMMTELNASSTMTIIVEDYNMPLSTDNNTIETTTTTAPNEIEEQETKTTFFNADTKKLMPITITPVPPCCVSDNNNSGDAVTIGRTLRLDQSSLTALPDTSIARSDNSETTVATTMENMDTDHAAKAVAILNKKWPFGKFQVIANEQEEVNSRHNSDNRSRYPFLLLSPAITPSSYYMTKRWPVIAKSANTRRLQNNDVIVNGSSPSVPIIMNDSPDNERLLSIIINNNNNNNNNMADDESQRKRQLVVFLQQFALSAVGINLSIFLMTIGFIYWRIAGCPSFHQLLEILEELSNNSATNSQSSYSLPNNESNYYVDEDAISSNDIDGFDNNNNCFLTNLVKSITIFHLLLFCSGLMLFSFGLAISLEIAQGQTPWLSCRSSLQAVTISTAAVGAVVLFATISKTYSTTCTRLFTIL